MKPPFQLMISFYYELGIVNIVNGESICYSSKLGIGVALKAMP